MTARTSAGATALAPPAPDAGAAALAPLTPDQTSDGWDAEWLADLDVTVVESGVAAEQLIRMTDDGCNSTCGTACVSCGT